MVLEDAEAVARRVLGIRSPPADRVRPVHPQRFDLASPSAPLSTPPSDNERLLQANIAALQALTAAVQQNIGGPSASAATDILCLNPRVITSSHALYFSFR